VKDTVEMSGWHRKVFLLLFELEEPEILANSPYSHRLEILNFLKLA